MDLLPPSRRCIDPLTSLLHLDHSNRNHNVQPSPHVHVIRQDLDFLTTVKRQPRKLVGGRLRYLAGCVNFTLIGLDWDCRL